MNSSRHTHSHARGSTSMFFSLNRQSVLQSCFKHLDLSLWKLRLNAFWYICIETYSYIIQMFEYYTAALSCPEGANHNSVVITVFNSGILDFSLFLFNITLSLTSQGEMSSRLVSPLSFTPLLLMKLELTVSLCSLLFTWLRLFVTLVFDKLEAEKIKIFYF